MAAASDAGAAGAARASPPKSGISGIVLYGPTCPVERPGHSCERPCVATLTFQRAARRGATPHVRSGTDGRFLRDAFEVVGLEPHRDSIAERKIGIGDASVVVSDLEAMKYSSPPWPLEASRTC